MAEYEHLNNAPIREAIIEIRVVPNEKFDLKIFNPDEGEFKIDCYPDFEIRRKGTVKFEIKDGTPTTDGMQHEDVGCKFKCLDEKHIVQFYSNKFSFSELEPYDEWENFKNKALELWKIYSDTAKPSKIIRISTRFINEIKLPLPIKDFGDYFTAPPIIPDGLPQSLSSYLIRFVVPDPNTGAVALVTQSLELVEKQEFIPILLDIDAIMNVGEIDVDIVATLDTLRDFKNDIFFKSITDKAKELFK